MYFHLTSFITIYNHRNWVKWEKNVNPWVEKIQSLYSYKKEYTYGHSNIWLHVRAIATHEIIFIVEAIQSYLQGHCLNTQKITFSFLNDMYLNDWWLLYLNTFENPIFIIHETGNTVYIWVLLDYLNNTHW